MKRITKFGKNLVISQDSQYCCSKSGYLFHDNSELFHFSDTDDFFDLNNDE